MMTVRRLLVLLALLMLTGSVGAEEPPVKPEDLPRVPPTEARDAHKTLRVRPGFRAALVAAEPDVVDPIAICFDENGRMFVVEMRDYSERRAERLGRIRMLEDLDGDGVYEKSTVFLKDLPWPTAVICVNGGVLVGACPDILFARDTDGDGVADQITRLFTGFGSTQEKLNVQGLFNNFLWGLDNRIHGCSGHDGGLVQRVATTAPALDVTGKGFVIDPRAWTMTTEHGGGQYGLSFDPEGRLFTCSNSMHIEMFMYDARYVGLNPHAVLPPPRVCIAADGPAAEVFRASPEEPWRVMRTRWRIAGLVPGPIEGGGRSAGYFTGATGITIYTGDAFGPDYVGDAFVGDSGGNLVHHKRMHPGADGVEPVAQRPPDEQKTEFVASTDNWFRPVDFANAPDGALYVADMYREIIEHPWSIPPSIKKYLDLNSGNDRGRIWRIEPEGFTPRKPPRLASATTAELVATLEHPNGWHRQTAARLLFERHDPAAVPLLEKLLTDSRSALGRMHALYALHGLDALREAHVVAMLADVEPVVREHALKLAERFADSPPVRARLLELADEPSPRVRYQLAWSLGFIDAPDRTKLLIRLIRRDGKSQWMRAAVLNSLGRGAGEAFRELSVGEDAAVDPFLLQLAGMIGAANQPQDIAAVTDFLAGCKDEKTSFAVASAVADGGLQDRSVLRPLIAHARDVAMRANATVPQRLRAIPLLAYSEDRRCLLDLLAERSQPIQLAALAALDRSDGPDISRAVIARWPQFPPRVRREAAALLLKRPQGAMELLRAVASHDVEVSDLDANQIQFLRDSRDADVKQLARRLLPAPASRDAVVESFRPALSLPGDSSRGKVIYQKLCISCHRAADEGFAVGPDLVTVRNSGKAQLLLNVLDPDRQVAPNYVAFVIETKDDQTVLGIITSDTPASIIVRGAYGKEVVIPRDRIKRMISSKKSMMPEGLETGLSQQDLADLLEFISAVR